MKDIRAVRHATEEFPSFRKGEVVPPCTGLPPVTWVCHIRFKPPTHSPDATKTSFIRCKPSAEMGKRGTVCKMVFHPGERNDLRIIAHLFTDDQGGVMSSAPIVLKEPSGNGFGTTSLIVRADLEYPHSPRLHG